MEVLKMRMLIDWCPICGKKLSDSFKKTRWEHDKKFHPNYFTAQTGLERNDLFYKEKLK